ncbi:hypothetical protein TNCV_1105051 [Trichonephila clavipes]|nr:hypothetical protein TNCV_1105051 [Trichonephila clavipes]
MDSLGYQSLSPTDLGRVDEETASTGGRPLQTHGNDCMKWFHQCTQNILEPIFEEEIPTSYGKGIDKVELHTDKASGQTSKSTAAYLAEKESETG